MRIVGKTDIGMGRKENQDNYRAGRMQDDTVWAVVCDGMGGTRGGAIASSVAVETMENELLRGLAEPISAAGIHELLDNAAQRANTRVYDLARHDETKRVMGTTLVAVILKNNTVYYVHAGDSRAYLHRAGVLDRLTKDHSIVQEMIENGTLTEEEAVTHPKKNLITRALGVNDTLQLDYGERQVRSGDLILLCSDGLTNAAPEQAIAAALSETPFFETADKLISLALDAEGQDNITAVLVKVENAH